MISRMLLIWECTGKVMKGPPFWRIGASHDPRTNTFTVVFKYKDHSGPEWSCTVQRKLSIVERSAILDFFSKGEQIRSRGSFSLTRGTWNTVVHNLLPGVCFSSLKITVSSFSWSLFLQCNRGREREHGCECSLSRKGIH
jgi:hypothetical protein